MLQRLFFLQIHTGGKVIGWLWSILSFLAIALLLNSLVKRSHPDVIFCVMTLCLSLFLFLLIASILLIVGIKKNSHVLLLPWLISFVCFLVVNYLIIVIGLFDIIRHRAIHLGDCVGEVVFCLILVLSIYMYYGIYSLYRHLKSIPVSTTDPETSLSK